MIKTKAAFLEGRLFNSQLEPFKNFSDCSDWWIKADSPKSHFCFRHVNRLLMQQELISLGCDEMLHAQHQQLFINV